jgi:hypothetical protein
VRRPKQLIIHPKDVLCNRNTETAKPPKDKNWCACVCLPSTANKPLQQQTFAKGGTQYRMLGLGRFPSSSRGYQAREDSDSSMTSVGKRKSAVELVMTDSPVAMSTFFLSSLAMFSVGLLIGFRRVSKFQKVALNETPAPIDASMVVLGSKAFLIGTGLCFSGAGILIGAFSLSTGIRDPKAFALAAKQSLTSMGVIPPVHVITPEIQQELDQLEQDAEKSYDELFRTEVGDGDSTIDGESAKRDMSWQMKIDRFRSLMTTLRQAFDLSFQQREQNLAAEKAQQAADDAAPGDKPKWQRKLERIFGLNKK